MQCITHVISRFRIDREQRRLFRRELADQRHVEHMARQAAGIRDLGGYLG